MRQGSSPDPAPLSTPLPRPPSAADRPCTQELKVAILRTADIVRRRTGAVVARRGLTFQQYNVLRILRGAGPAPLGRFEIAARTLESVPQLGELLAELAGRALIRIERGADSSDAHTITVGGMELLAELDVPVADADRAALDGLSDEEARVLIALLERLRARP